eukprot:47071-Eustigmatos_ZCMA.PRE.1
MMHVSDYMTRWPEYKHYAHMFQYSDFIQSHCTDLTETELRTIADMSPGTYLIHGSDSSAGNAR